MQEDTENSELFNFINEQIEEMKEATRLGTDKEISFFELESALKKYTSVYLSLISLHNFARLDVQQAQERFNSWYSVKFIEIRNDTNRPELTAQKWASQKEIEHMVRARYEHEYIKHKDALLQKEHKLEFLNNLIDMWKSHQFILSTLSSNIRAEAGMAQ